ncbi:hypothetical protein BDN70DRAFT_952381 [Pholiota conissans]|uniref:Uncharacterized protein n=1 Tax=Pholiota conissans TaxID=109636 RepID=A0A9P6CX00_9AGAR|nr:hypothetical protein BDN70DRAFT_952381 [Pholiota conissans]
MWTHWRLRRSAPALKSACIDRALHGGENGTIHTRERLFLTGVLFLFQNTKKPTSRALISRCRITFNAQLHGSTSKLWGSPRRDAIITRGGRPGQSTNAPKKDVAKSYVCMYITATRILQARGWLSGSAGGTGSARSKGSVPAAQRMALTDGRLALMHVILIVWRTSVEAWREDQRTSACARDLLHRVCGAPVRCICARRFRGLTDPTRAWRRKEAARSHAQPSMPPVTCNACTAGSDAPCGVVPTRPSSLYFRVFVVFMGAYGILSRVHSSICGLSITAEQFTLGDSKLTVHLLGSDHHPTFSIRERGRLA